MLFRAKANKALDRAEDPREMLDYSYQRQLELLQQVRRGLADVATSRTALRADTRDATGTAGAFHQRPGDRRPLPPPTGHVGVALVDGGIELPGHAGHEVTRLRHGQCVPQLRLDRLGPAEPQVAGHGAAEQERPLRDQPDTAPQLFQVLVPHVGAVDEHRAGGCVEEPGDEVEPRVFAAAGTADDGAGLTGTDGEGQGVQDRMLAAWVPERDGAELHLRRCCRPW